MCRSETVLTNKITTCSLRLHASGQIGPGQQSGPRHMGGRQHNDSDSFHSSIVKDEDLKDFDKLSRKPGDSHDDGWAGTQADLDYR